MSDPDSVQLHATSVAINGHGVLLLGPPGSGKSDLALRLIDEPGYGLGDELLHAKLIGDDQIVLTRRGDQLIAAPAGPLAGLLEIRGLGIANCPHQAEAPLVLAVDLVSQAVIERLPDKDDVVFCQIGVEIRQISLDAGTPSAPARVRAGLMAALNG